ncbi:MAG: hypothetical protein MZV70_05805 [Desulfobacterales bacterium]|nr:hypothetical protein [Desulfobacterales bacterium]
MPGSRVMDYKADFGPAEIARDGEWIPLDAGSAELPPEGRMKPRKDPAVRSGSGNARNRSAPGSTA